MKFNRKPLKLYQFFFHLILSWRLKTIILTRPDNTAWMYIWGKNDAKACHGNISNVSHDVRKEYNVAWKCISFRVISYKKKELCFTFTRFLFIIWNLCAYVIWCKNGDLNWIHEKKEEKSAAVSINLVIFFFYFSKKKENLKYLRKNFRIIFRTTHQFKRLINLWLFSYIKSPFSCHNLFCSFI